MRGAVTGTDRVTRSRSGSRAAAQQASRSPTRRSPRRATRCSSWRPRTTGRLARPPPPARTYVQYYLEALAQNGVAADVYDVDKRGRIAPDQLGVLGHYEGVIWYTGDDVVTRKAGLGRRQRRPARARRDARDPRLHGRGRPRRLHGQARRAAVLRRRGRQSVLRPKNEVRATRRGNPAQSGPRRCLLLRGSIFGGDLVNDVLEYWFGGNIQVAGDGFSPDDAVRPQRHRRPVRRARVALNGPESANNQTRTRRSSTTSGILPPDEYPQFESWPSSRWDKPGGPFEPHSGTQYAYSQIADVSYKRLTREIAVPAGGGDLTFWTSYDTEETGTSSPSRPVRPAATDWTTLPDANGTRPRKPARAPAARRAGSSCTRISTTTRRSTREPPTLHAQRGHDGATGTPLRATRTAGSSGRSTSTSGPARRSRSRSPTSATGARITSACSWTSSRGRAARRRSRAPTPAAGRSPVRRRQRSQREQLEGHRRRWLPGRRLDHHAQVAPDGLRVRGVSTEDQRNKVMGRIATTCSPRRSRAARRPLRRPPARARAQAARARSARGYPSPPACRPPCRSR